jgi:ribosomal protein L11 methyltransferase
MWRRINRPLTEDKFYEIKSSKRISMQYTKVTFTLSPTSDIAKDVMQAQLGELGYESFVDTAEGFEAYVQTDGFDLAAVGSIDAVVPGVSYTFVAETVPDTDWNAEWEKSFASVRISEDVLVRSPFAASEGAKYEIVISPRMAFGTGKHETTQLMADWIVSNDVSGQRLLDMGCGTGILGILARMRGASEVLWVDYDKWCVDNTVENLGLNGIDAESADVRHGGAEVVLDMEEKFDIVLANINRNVLVKDMSVYATVLRKGGRLVLSGFYDIDIPNLVERAGAYGLTFEAQKVLNSWARLELIKNK